MATHSSTLAWKIPWMEEPGRLQSMGLLRIGHDWATSLSVFIFMHWRRKWQPTRVLVWRIPGMGEPGGLPSMGSHRVRHNWSDLAAGAVAAYNRIYTTYTLYHCSWLSLKSSGPAPAGCVRKAFVFPVLLYVSEPILIIQDDFVSRSLT